MVNSNFDLLYAVPIFASNKLLAKWEETSIYDMQAIDNKVSFTRYYQHSPNCSLYEKKGFKLTDEEDFSQFPSFGGHSKQCNNVSSQDFSLLSFTGLHMSDDQSFTLLITCSESEKNITVIAGCFLLDRGLNLAKELEGFLRVNQIPEFPLFKIDFENRLKSFKEITPNSKNNLYNLFKRCPKSMNMKTPGNFTIDLVLYIGLGIIITAISLYLLIQKIKWNSVFPLRE